MGKAILYLHGKGGSAKEADRYKALCPEYDVFGMDDPFLTPWETKEKILAEYERLRINYDAIAIIANSIGAYFAMNALAGRPIEKALFISPIVDMEKLISDMMRQAGVTEAELQEKREIETSFGERLSWRYLCYVRENPIRWNVRTDILYAGKDNLTSYETVSQFANKANASLTIMENGEHWFHTKEQLDFLNRWLKSHL